MKTTYVFDKLLAAAVDPNIRGVSSRGGTRSSKTWSMLQLIYLMATQSETPLLISCVTDTLPGVKRGMFRDFKRMLQDEGVWEEKRMQYTDMMYTTECRTEYLSGVLAAEKLDLRPVLRGVHHIGVLHPLFLEHAFILQHPFEVSEHTTLHSGQRIGDTRDEKRRLRLGRHQID